MKTGRLVNYALDSQLESEAQLTHNISTVVASDNPFGIHSKNDCRMIQSLFFF